MEKFIITLDLIKLIDSCGHLTGAAHVLNELIAGVHKDRIAQQRESACAEAARERVARGNFTLVDLKTLEKSLAEKDGGQFKNISDLPELSKDSIEHLKASRLEDEDKKQQFFSSGGPILIRMHIVAQDLARDIEQNRVKIVPNSELQEIANAVQNSISTDRPFPF